MKAWDVVVIGSGPCGLTIAHRLRDAGRSVLVLDKGARPGGRLASRPIAGVLLNNAAESLRVEDPAVAHEIGRRTRFPVPSRWIFPEPAGTLAARWAEGLALRRLLVTRLEFDAPGYIGVRSPDAPEAVTAHAVVLTLPVPQALQILRSSAVVSAVPPVSYEKRLVLLGAVDGTVEARAGGSAIIDEVRVRSTGVEVIAAAGWSSEIWNVDPARAQYVLEAQVERMFPHARIHEVQVKRWRYANALATVPGPGFLRVRPLLYLAGDGFGEPGPPSSGIARAVRSGMAVAAAVLAELSSPPPPSPVGRPAS